MKHTNKELGPKGLAEDFAWALSVACVVLVCLILAMGIGIGAALAWGFS
jgi:hypothetical protein